MRVLLKEFQGTVVLDQVAMRVGAYSKHFDSFGIRSGPHDVNQLLQNFLRRLELPADQVYEGRWLQATEVLIRHLDDLLDDKERLERELAAALGDLEVAEARVAQLEHLSEGLKAEAYRAKDHSNQKLVGAIAVAIITSLGLMGQAHLGRPRAEAAEKAKGAAERVILQCGDQKVTVNPTINIPQPTPPGSLPGTS